ncbi:MAG: hypothetical protein ACNA8W_11510 [Bradymonadaceae bacterium]
MYRFADLHCHPTFYAFNRMRHTPGLAEDPELYHPWHELPSNINKMNQGTRAMEYAQSNFARLTEGGVRLVFASFTPIEKGFFVGNITRKETDFTTELLSLVSGYTFAKSARRLIEGGPPAAAREATRILRNRGPFRQLLQSFVLKYSLPRVRHILSPQYDYWDELVSEYAFIKSRDGVRMEVEVDLGDGKREVEGCYHVIRTGDQLASVMEESDRDTAVILTIEGAHVFSIGPDQHPVSEELMFSRIAEMKNWQHPILFITLAHHFDNGLCGHAHSLVDAATLVMDQRLRLHEDFERRDDLGLRVVRELLDIDENLKDGNGRRIFIDVRHMSPRTRKSYYAEIVEPYNKAKKNKKSRPKIPVVMSHCGYAGVATLDEMIENGPREDDHWHQNPFYAWGINLSDEDVRIIHDSEGLIGLCFDQRVAGLPPAQKLGPENQPRLLINQIFGVVDVIMQDDRLPVAEKIKVWDRVCIGSDYDGVIDPISAYPTAVAFPRFADDLHQALERHRHTRLIAEIGVEALVEKICWRNAYEFALDHMPAACGEAR